MGWGLLLEKLNKKDEAINIYKKGVEKGNIDSAYFLGNLYIQEKNYKECRKYYLIGAKRSEKVATSAIGYCYEMEGNYEEAKKWYKKAVDLGEKKFASERLQDIGNK